MANDWDTPPTEDEINAAWGAPPTEAERNAARASAAPKKPPRIADTTAGQTFVDHFANAGSFGFGDELGAGFQAGLQGLSNVFTDNDRPMGDVYREALRGNRAALKVGQEEHGGAALAGTGLGAVTGGIATLPVSALNAARVPGAMVGAGKWIPMAARGAQAVKAGMAGGALYGAGASEADLTSGRLGEYLQLAQDVGSGAAVGGLVGGLAQGGTELLSAGLGKLKGLASSRLQAAKEKAAAIAQKEEDEIVDRLHGKYRSEVQQTSRMAENVRRIPGSPVSGETDAIILANDRAMESLGNTAKQLEAQVTAAGLKPDALAKSSEFAAKGTAVADAQVAAKELARVRAAMSQLARQTEELRTGAVTAADDAGLMTEREALMSSPIFPTTENQVLRNTIQEYPGQFASMQSAKAVADAAREAAPANIAKRTEQLLSPAQAAHELSQRIDRYAPPIVGTLLGGQGITGTLLKGAIGGGIGYAATGDWGKASLGALAGAGARPAFQAMSRMAKHPSVQTMTWSPVQKILSAPDAMSKVVERLGPEAGPGVLRALSEAAQEGEQRAAVTWFLLSQQHPALQMVADGSEDSTHGAIADAD